MSPTLSLNPDSALPVQRFVEGFVARLVEHGWNSIAPQDPTTRRALSAVVAQLDQWIAEFEDSGVEWDKIAPWVQMANSLRPTALGGVENWEHQLRLAQDFLVKVPNPDYETVDLSMSLLTAQHELEQFTVDQKRVIDLAASAFEDLASIAA